MGKQKSPKLLAKFLDYVLGRNPGEFGLVPDENGYVKIKELIKALNDEDGWRHVRKALIDEILLTISDPPIEIKGNFIRAKNRENLPAPEKCYDPPKILYAFVRKKAHAFVLEKGINPLGGRPFVILFSHKKMAEKVGKRYDSSCIIITVQTRKCMDMGILFDRFGDDIFLAPFVPKGGFTAPPLPKEKTDPAKKKKPDKKEEKPVPKTPGSFFLDLSDDPAEKKKRRKKLEKKKKARKKEWKKARKLKERF